MPIAPVQTLPIPSVPAAVPAVAPPLSDRCHLLCVKRRLCERAGVVVGTSPRVTGTTHDTVGAVIATATARGHAALEHRLLCFEGNETVEL
jgi:hypothetical protein